MIHKMTKDHSEANLQENVIAHVLAYNNVLITRRKAFLIKSALIKIAETTIYNLDCFEKGKASGNEVS